MQTSSTQQSQQEDSIVGPFISPSLRYNSRFMTNLVNNKKGNNKIMYHSRSPPTMSAATVPIKQASSKNQDTDIVNTTGNSLHQISTAATNSYFYRDTKLFEKQMQVYGLNDKIQQISSMNQYIQENMSYRLQNSTSQYVTSSPSVNNYQNNSPRCSRKSSQNQQNYHRQEFSKSIMNAQNDKDDGSKQLQKNNRKKSKTKQHTSQQTKYQIPHHARNNSGSIGQKYIFPFQRRARSYSPDKNYGSQSSINDDQISCQNSSGALLSKTGFNNQNSARQDSSNISGKNPGKIFSLKFNRGSGQRSCDQIRNNGSGPIIAKNNFFFCDQQDFKDSYDSKKMKKQSYKSEEDEFEMLKKYFMQSKSWNENEIEMIDCEKSKGQQLKSSSKNDAKVQQDQWMFETIDTRTKPSRQAIKQQKQVKQFKKMTDIQSKPSISSVLRHNYKNDDQDYIQDGVSDDDDDDDDNDNDDKNLHKIPEQDNKKFYPTAQQQNEQQDEQQDFFSGIIGSNNKIEYKNYDDSNQLDELIGLKF